MLWKAPSSHGGAFPPFSLVTNAAADVPGVILVLDLALIGAAAFLAKAL